MFRVLASRGRMYAVLEEEYCVHTPTGSCILLKIFRKQRMMKLGNWAQTPIPGFACCLVWGWALFSWFDLDSLGSCIMSGLQSLICYSQLYLTVFQHSNVWFLELRILQRSHSYIKCFIFQKINSPPERIRKADTYQCWNDYHRSSIHNQGILSSSVELD